jgi:chemotaxis protein CheD
MTGRRDDPRAGEGAQAEAAVPAPDPESGSRRLAVEAGSAVVSNRPGDVLATVGPIGSSVVVCLSNAIAGVAGLLHFAWPDSALDPAQAASQPAHYADTGLTLLFEQAERLGVAKARCKVRLVGAANVPDRTGSEKWAKRNLLAARSLLWRNGVFLDGEDVGGTRTRTATLAVEGGQLVVETDGDGTVNAEETTGKQER